LAEIAINDGTESNRLAALNRIDDTDQLARLCTYYKNNVKYSTILMSSDPILKKYHNNFKIYIEMEVSKQRYGKDGLVWLILSDYSVNIISNGAEIFSRRYLAERGKPVEWFKRYSMGKSHEAGIVYDEIYEFLLSPVGESDLREIADTSIIPVLREAAAIRLGNLRDR